MRQKLGQNNNKRYSCVTRKRPNLCVFPPCAVGLFLKSLLDALRKTFDFQGQTRDRAPRGSPNRTLLEWTRPWCGRQCSRGRLLSSLAAFQRCPALLYYDGCHSYGGILNKFNYFSKNIFHKYSMSKVKTIESASCPNISIVLTFDIP